MYFVAICDDEIFTCATVERALLLYAKNEKIQIEVGVFTNGEDFLKTVKLGEHWDILFLDIELVSLNGIDVAQYIRDEMNNEAMQIIYISSKQQYAMQLFKTRPFDFMIKPFTDDEIIKTFLRAKKLIDRGKELFEFSINQNYYKIPLNSIQYFKSSGRKVYIYLEDDIIEFYGRIDDIAKEMQNGDFWRIHKSYYINYNFVIEYTYEWVKMKNGDILSISQANRSGIRSNLLRRQGDKKHEYRKCD